MSVASFLSLPRPIVFGLYGVVAALVIELTFGELIWWQVRPSPPSETVVDAAPPTPPAKLSVTASPHVSLYPGHRNIFRVRITRDHFDGPVTLKFTPSSSDLNASDLIIPANETTGQVNVVAAMNMKPGKYRLNATAEASSDESLSSTTTVNIEVVPIPPPAPRLAVSASPTIQMYPQEKNSFAVRVERGEFRGEVRVTFDGLPDGVVAQPITIPAGKTEAIAELLANANVMPGSYPIAVTARAGSKSDIIATTESQVELLAHPKLPLDIVFALDCTGSMKKSVEGISRVVPHFADELAKSQFDVRLGLVSFQDTTLGQPVRILLVNGEKMSANIAQFSAGVGKMRLGGGGGEGESSLDGIADAADSPFRDRTTRVIVLITDGGPKRIDGRMKSMEETVKHLHEKKIDQLHVVALPDHKKAFEPLWSGVKGVFFDLQEANSAQSYDKLMSAVAKAIVMSAPKPPTSKPEPSSSAPKPVLVPFGSIKPPDLPVGVEPVEPESETRVGVEIPANSLENRPDTPGSSKAQRVIAAGTLAGAMVVLVSLALLLGQLTFLPGQTPPLGIGSMGYAAGLVVGLVASTVGFLVVGAASGPFLGRLNAACLFGLCMGVAVSLAESLVRAEEPPSISPVLSNELPPPEPPLELDDSLPEPPLELDDEPTPESVVAPVPPIKPNITAPKSPNDCPGCGRKIPGLAGERYCMLCDMTF